MVETPQCILTVLLKWQKKKCTNKYIEKNGDWKRAKTGERETNRNIEISCSSNKRMERVQTTTKQFKTKIKPLFNVMNFLVGCTLGFLWAAIAFSETMKNDLILLRILMHCVLPAGQAEAMYKLKDKNNAHTYTKRQWHNRTKCFHQNTKTETTQTHTISLITTIIIHGVFVKWNNKIKPHKNWSKIKPFIVKRNKAAESTTNSIFYVFKQTKERLIANIRTRAHTHTKESAKTDGLSSESPKQTDWSKQRQHNFVV